MMQILRDILRFIFSPNSTNAACLAIGLGSWLDDKDLTELSDYYKSLHDARLRRKIKNANTWT